MNRRQIICANWKMNQISKEMVANFCQQFKLLPPTKSNSNLTIAVAPSTIYLDMMQKQNLDFMLVAQHCCFAAKGAYTGETSVLMLADLKIKMCLVGHSERRQIFSESDAQVNAQVLLLLTHHLQPILCIGEPLVVFQSQKTIMFLTHQLRSALKGVSLDQARQLIIAYEPIWAIGTGQVADSNQIQQLVVQLRTILAERFSPSVAIQIPIIYGGSVNSENAQKFLIQPDIDGLLVGGASLDPVSFYKIVRCCRG